MSLRDVVAKFIDDLRVSGALPISAPYVAGEVVAGFPHYSIMDEVEQTAAYMGTVQVAREILRAHGRDAYDPEKVAQHDLDLPEAALLNEAYSVERDGEPMYVPREMMTRDDMEYVCAKFDALSGYFARASRAIRADFERRNRFAG